LSERLRVLVFQSASRWGLRTVAVAPRAVYRAPKIWSSAILSRKIFLGGPCREFNDWWRVIKGSSQSDTAVLAASPPTRTSARPHERGIWGRWRFCQGNCPILVALINSVVSTECIKGLAVRFPHRSAKIRGQSVPPRPPVIHSRGDPHCGRAPPPP
jgi:hypothetical protein